MFKRNIDILLEDYGFKYVGLSKKSNYQHTYDAIIRDIKNGNITDDLYYISYDIILIFAREEWEFNFDKVEFEKSVRVKHKAQCKFIRMLPFKENLVTVLYDITILDKNNK